jgi:nucleoside-diphosphate-sugar epimerase
LRDMKVAVTGATGFVGRHVVAALLAQGADVVATARVPERIQGDSNRLTKVSLDLDDTEGAYSRMGEPEALVHLAWGGLPNYRSNTHLDSELPRQIAFLEACAGAGLRRLVVAGTCLEYGMQSGCLDEELPIAPITAYGHAKDRLRAHLQAVANRGGPQLTWLRLFYLYGPGQAPTSLYSQLRAAIASGAVEFPMSPGDQQRDFLPVETAAAHVGALTMNAPGAGIVNVCSGVPKTVAVLVREWLREAGATVRLDLGKYPYPDYEPRAFWGSARKLESLVGKT